MPAGSGNGFARELGIPSAPERRRWTSSCTGSDQRVDVGRLNGRSFFNIAGIGFDAAIADALQRLRTWGERGLWPYFRIAVEPGVPLPGEPLPGRRWTTRPFDSRALMVAFANGREYGNGLRLAPHARLDDGRLEAIVVDDRGPLARLWSGRHLAFGTSERAGGVTWRSIERAQIEADGVPLSTTWTGSPSVGRGRARDPSSVRGALQVRVPGRGPSMSEQ